MIASIGHTHRKYQVRGTNYEHNMENLNVDEKRSKTNRMSLGFTVIIGGNEVP